ncbi:MAG TPA: RdgB/HAM1 family non-canonical purine NTP pyrophosphatase [Clostridiales bacterium]|jgi:XTP/dITP diphosphohydrolase|nr:RdgB/HAM1 family non-canonical purine NTP pyrophosphatase [Clostridiales bacterium]
MDLIVATRNRHKIEEIEVITEAFGFRLLSLDDVGLTDLELIEDGTTFEENSLKKARAVFEQGAGAVLADDSGLAVDFLEGAPGVHSARFAGESADDQQNNCKLLRLLAGLPAEKRTARFICVMTLLGVDSQPLIARGECAGQILKTQRGNAGFGYDPLFLPAGQSQTFAEMPSSIKNRISHRAMALRELGRLIGELKGGQMKK